MLVIRSFSVKLPGGNSHRIMLSIAGTTLWFWWSLARFIASLRTEPGYTWCPPRGWCFVQVWCQDVSSDMYSFWGWVTKTSQGISITTRMTPNFKTFVDLHCEKYHWIDHQSYQNHGKGVLLTRCPKTQPQKLLKMHSDARTHVRNGKIGEE